MVKTLDWIFYYTKKRKGGGDEPTPGEDYLRVTPIQFNEPYNSHSITLIQVIHGALFQKRLVLEMQPSQSNSKNTRERHQEVLKSK